jgi:hypothetical protein
MLRIRVMVWKWMWRGVVNDLMLDRKKLLVLSIEECETLHGGGCATMELSL